jgi:hypothetical protein
MGVFGEGLELHKVYYDNVKVLHKASLPVIRVKYSNTCGPFKDQITTYNISPTNCGGPQYLCVRQDSEWFEVGVFSEIGEYDLYHAWYFSKSGRLESRLWSRGWSCSIDHDHHPYWRLDFDVNDTRNRVYRFQATDPSYWFPDDLLTYNRELNEAQPSNRFNIFWWVDGPPYLSASDFVLVQPGYTEPSDSFSTKDVGVRRYHKNENHGWAFAASSNLGFLNGENVRDQDLVLWWVGHLFHDRIDGVDEDGLVWHWSGPVIIVGWSPAAQ